MTTYEDQNYTIYFGDESKSIKLSQSDLKKNLEGSLDNFKESFKIENLVFLNQVHGTSGIVISKDYEVSCPIDVPTVHGDIIITDRLGVGIGVLTADCMPIVFYDRTKHVLAIAHAGWKGSIEGIAGRTVSMMKERFSCDTGDIEIHFGPSAKPCCYEVQSDFIEHLSDREKSLFITNKDDKNYFDKAAFNASKLVEIGIAQDKISLDHHNCTICNHNYCSHRRDAKEAGRQVTVAVLK